MADTSQIVSWALERECRFRGGDDWFLPCKTSIQLSDLHTLSNGLPDGRIVDGVCVTSWSRGHDNKKNCFRIPRSGIRVEERLAKWGGFEHTVQTCTACEANATGTTGDTVLAGCHGHLRVWPECPELEEQLWKTIDQRGLEARLRTAFPVTTPLWFGFWIGSPLKRFQVELLVELFEPVFDAEDRSKCNIDRFLVALRKSMDWELPLHVSLSPLGHTDFGWYTIFPHCPRCKANAPVGRWKQTYPTEPHACQVCGHRFIPNEHHSSTKDGFDFEPQSLERQLGEPAYANFVHSFLRHEGCSESQIEEILDNERNGPLLRQIGTARTKRRATLTAARAGLEATSIRTELPRHTQFALRDGLQLEFVLVPAGEFLMGSPSSEQGHTHEKPQHIVRITSPFYMGRFPKTRGQWQAVMGENPSFHEGDRDLPVDQVSWIDCQEFCDMLCTRLKRPFRLPSEAEWEYACRAGTTTAYAFGDTLLPDQANFRPLEEFKSGGKRKQTTTPVGSFLPNHWGLYDMHGNVDEWCEDVWHDNYDGSPDDGGAWLVDEDKQAFRVTRGGWCHAAETVCRSASRRKLRADAGSYKKERMSIPLLKLLHSVPYGFRVVCEIV